KLFRMKYLSTGQLPGETLDLGSMVADLKLDEATLDKLKPMLEQYEIALDQALHKREQYVQSSQDDLFASIQDKNYSIGEEVIERQVGLRKGVRDVNDTFAIQLAAAMPAEMGASFTRTVRETTYPRIYRKIPAERSFEAAAKL